MNEKKMDKIKTLVNLHTEALWMREFALKELGKMFDVTKIERHENQTLLTGFIRWTVKNSIRLDVCSYGEIEIFAAKYLDHLAREHRQYVGDIED